MLGYRGVKYLYHDLWVLLTAGQKFSVGILATVSRLEELGKAGSDAIKSWLQQKHVYESV